MSKTIFGFFNKNQYFCRQIRSKTMNRLLPFFIFTVALMSCGNNTTDPGLIQIDSLLSKRMYAPAYSAISKIDTSKYREKDKAYYFLLRNHILYRLGKDRENDTAVLRSIQYYKEAGDKEKLARAYLGRGEVLSNKGKIKEATGYFKEAENIANNTEDPETKIQICAHLSYLNRKADNLNKALEYGKKALMYAKRADDKQWIGYCLDNLGVICYYMKSMKDYVSYIKQAEPYIKYQTYTKQAGMLDNLSSLHKLYGEYGKAEYYLKKSLEIYPMDRTYGLLAELYSEQGKTSDIETLWKRALYSERLETRQYTMRPYAEWLYTQKRYKEALDIAMQIPTVTDSLYQRRQTETIKEVQDSYDRKIEHIRHENKRKTVFAGIGFLWVVLLTVWLYYHLKVQKAKKQLAENHILIADYNARIRQLEKESRKQTEEEKKQSMEIRELKRRLDALRGKQAEVLYKGKEKFDNIMNGGNTKLWHKSDFNEVVEYYRSINMPFVLRLENDYKSLSAGNKFYLLLSEELKYKDEDICLIMGLSDGALRTTKYRIKQNSLNKEFPGNEA